MGEVRLLKATKIPSGYQKLVQVRIDKEVEKGILLFTPGLLEEEGVLLADSVVTTEGERSVKLVVENHSHEMVRLGKGVQLVMVMPVELIESQSNSVLVAEENAEVVCQLNAEPPQPDRVEQLRNQLDLDLDLTHLTDAERQQLGSLLTSYADVFALKASELGTTDVVTHSIDTGDH